MNQFIYKIKSFAGYWGDIVVSPYIAFGIECDDEEFFKRANKQFVSNSEAITKHNLTTLLYELQTGKVHGLFMYFHIRY